MANVLVRESSLEAIADAIREKLDTEDTYKPSEMANAIEAISGGGITPTGTIDRAASTVVFTNTHNEEKGSLKVTKRVVGTITSKTFEFVVSQTDSSGTTTYYLEDGTTTTDITKGTLTIKDGETRTFSNLNAGT